MTRTYAHPAQQQQPDGRAPVKASKWARFARFTGMSPFSAERFGVFVWVVFTLWLIGTLPALGYAFAVVSAAGFAWWRWQMSVKARAAAIEAARPPRPAPGPAWCDHCAEWTVHDTAQHARV